MNEQQQEHLEALRNAAHQNQWNQCRELLAKLLPDLKESTSLRLVVRLVQRFLADLLRAYPEDGHIAGAIEALNNITSLEELDHQGQLICSLMNKYQYSFGVSNFTNAFKGISKPWQYFEHSGEYIDTLTSMIIAILSAICGNNYRYSHPGFSKIFFGPDHRKAVLMLAKINAEPDQKAFRQALWVELISDLDKALQAV